MRTLDAAAFRDQLAAAARAFIGEDYLWGGGSPGDLEVGPRDCSGLVGSLYGIAHHAELVELVDWRDRGAVNRPDPERRTPGGWLWESERIWPVEVAPGDLAGWPERRHVAMVVAVAWDGDARRTVTIIEASGGCKAGRSYGRIRARHLAGPKDAAAFFARPRAAIIRAWADGRRVPA